MSVASGGESGRGSDGISFGSNNKEILGTLSPFPPPATVNGDLDALGEASAICLFGDRRPGEMSGGENPALGDKQLGFTVSGCVMLGERDTDGNGNFWVGDIT